MRTSKRGRLGVALRRSPGDGFGFLDGSQASGVWQRGYSETRRR